MLNSLIYVLFLKWHDWIRLSNNKVDLDNVPSIYFNLHFKMNDF